MDVHRRQGVVQHEDGRPADDRAGQGDALALPARQRVPLLTDPRVEAPGELPDETVGPGRPQRLPDVVVGRPGRPHEDVLPHRDREEDRVLESHPEVGPQGVEGDVPKVVPVEGHAPLDGVGETRDEHRRRRLPRTGHPDQGHRLAGPHLEVEAAQDPRRGVGVAHADPLEAQVSAGGRELDRPRTVGDPRLGIEQLQDALGGRHGLLGHRDDPPHVPDGPDEHQLVEDEGHQAPDGHPAAGDPKGPHEEDDRERQVDQQLVDRPEVRPQAHPFEVRPEQPGGPLAEQRRALGHASEGLHDAHADGRLLDGRREITLLVLGALRQHVPPSSEPVADDRDGGREPEGEQGQADVLGEEHGEDEQEGRRQHHQPHQPEPEEPADPGDVGDGALDELPRLPPVVEVRLEALEVPVEAVPQVVLEPEGDGPGGIAADEGEDRVGHAEPERHQGVGQQALMAAPVDDLVHEALDDLRLEHLRDQAPDRDDDGRGEVPAVGADEGEESAQGPRRTLPRVRRADSYPREITLHDAHPSLAARPPTLSRLRDEPSTVLSSGELSRGAYSTPIRKG